MSQRKWIQVLTVVFAVSIHLTGCTSNPGANTPKDRLGIYISKSFSVKSTADKAELLTYLTGEAKTRLSVWSDEQFQLAFIEDKREFSKLLVKDVKKVTDDQVQLTYELTYVALGKNAGAKVTQRKLAEMIRQDGNWLISNVHNLNEFVEFKDALSLP